MSMPESNDRRRHARLEMLEYAMVRLPGRTDSIRTVIVDVSLGGMQVRSRYELPVGTACVLTIGRGGKNPLVINAEVRYSTPIEESDLFSTGFKLHPNSAGERIEWVDYVHNIFQKQGEALLNQ